MSTVADLPVRYGDLSRKMWATREHGWIKISPPHIHNWGNEINVSHIGTNC